MALTKEKNIQIAALNSKGYAIEAIAKKAGVSKEEVKESLENRGRDYIELGAMSKGEKAEYIAGLSMDRLPIEEIVERTGLGKTSCYNYIKDGALRARKSRQAKADGEKKAEEASKPGRINEEFDKAVDKMIEESKEEEKKVYEEAAVEVESEPIKTENETREEAGIEPIIEPEVRQVGADMKILNICEEALKAAEKDMLSIYSRLSEAEQHAWDLGEIYANLMRARGEFV